MSQKKYFQDTSTPVVNRKRRESKPTPPEREFAKRTNIMNSPDNSQHQDLSFIQDNQPPLPQFTFFKLTGYFAYIILGKTTINGVGL
jgi:hypothetical protein